MKIIGQNCDTRGEYSSGANLQTFDRLVRFHQAIAGAAALLRFIPAVSCKCI